jgi:hypothetical protein
MRPSAQVAPSAAVSFTNARKTGRPPYQRSGTKR